LLGGETAPGGAENAEIEVPEGPSAEELAVQTRIDELIDQRATAMEAELKKRFDKQLQGLQGELDSAKKATEERDRLLQEKADREKAQQDAEALAAEVAAKEAKAKEAEAKEAERKREEAKLAEANAAALPAAATGGEANAQSPQNAQTTASKQAPPPIPTVRRGDLVVPGPGIIRPKVLNRLNPRFPEVARKMGRKGGTVKLRLLVDEVGKVRKVEALNKLGFGFDAEAMKAVRKTKYTPATADGVEVQMWIEVNVVFKQR
jgi:TonB family protein